MEKKIYPLEGDMLERLKPLIMSYQFKPYREHQIEDHLLESYVIDEIDSLLSHRDNFAFVAEERGTLVGLVSVERLDWDTKHFGIEMARIPHLIASDGYSKAYELKCKLISHVLAKCCQEKISHLSARVSKEDLTSIHALESKCFRLMDVIVTGSLDLRKREIAQIENQWHVREFRSNDVPKLVDIAIESFKENPVTKQHFNADPYLPKEKSEDLYVQWLINSCKGLADTVLVAEMNGTPVGFSACKVQTSLNEKIGVRFGVVFLTAVTPSARGKGIHASLLNAALHWFSDKVDIVETGAEISNYAVQRAWNRLGFKIVRSQCTFHWSPQMESDYRQVKKACAHRSRKP
jgi:ribosomal protein S18 acetylase RimI-like enzyme